MITRFRLEGTGFSREQCLAILYDGAEAIMCSMNAPNGWETTQEVVVLDPTDEIYKGRIVMKYTVPQEREDNDDGQG